MAASGKPPSIGVALLGLGVVGSGVYQTLQQRADAFTQRCGSRLEVRSVVVRQPQRARGMDLDPALLSTDPIAAVVAPEIDVVVELMGGEEPANRAVRAALEAGKHVVTANKELMAKRGPELLALAAAHGVELLYEASVGSGIPIIAPLKRDLQANEIRRIQAIINGTTNFMLTVMAQSGLSYAEALAEAQRRGYAEADPRNDVEGIDAAYKLAILASLAFHTVVAPEDVYCEGITKLAPRDFQYAAELGYVIRLLATATQRDGSLELRVHPALMPERDPLAQVQGVLNAVSVEGDLLGRAIFEGEGAGALPATSAVLADLLDVACGIAAGQRPRPARPADASPCIQPMDDLRMRYYFRMVVQDRPGVLAELAQLFARHGISIASLLQVEADAVAGTAELVITTHEAKESDIDQFTEMAVQMDAVQDIGVRLRMEALAP